MAGNESTSTEPGTVSVQELNDAIVAAHPALLRRALFLTRDHDQAIELVQRTVERACRSRCQLRPGSNPKHWLGAILISRFIDEVRYRRASHFISAFDCDRCAAPEPADAPIWTLLGTDDVMAAARRLPRRFREPFELFAFGRLSQRTIGARLGLPIGTIGTRIFRAKRLLRDLLIQRAALLRVDSSPRPHHASRTSPTVPAASARAATNPTRRPRSDVKTPRGSYLASIPSQRSISGCMARNVG